jgi:hypothetical protein
VSLIGGEFREAANTLYLREDMPLERMDWRMLVDVEVHLWANRATPLAQGAAGPRRHRARGPRPVPALRQPGGTVHDIDIGDGLPHAPRPRHPRGAPLHLVPNEQRRQQVGAKLRRALLAQHPGFTTL